MELYKEEWLNRIKEDFEQFKNKKTFTPADEGKLLADLTGLIGWFKAGPTRPLKTLIEEMLILGEKKKWSLAGPRIAFEHAKKEHQIK